jgi:hypothetical protein
MPAGAVDEAADARAVPVPVGRPGSFLLAAIELFLAFFPTMKAGRIALDSGSMMRR